MTYNEMIHILRNSYGHDESRVREARLLAADTIEYYRNRTVIEETTKVTEFGIPTPPKK